MKRFALSLVLGSAAALLGLSLACGGGSSAATRSYVIVAGAGANGTVSPAGRTPVAADASQSFTITPDPAYLVDQVLIDGSTDAGAVTSYTFTHVQADHTLAASFVAAAVTYTITVTQSANGTISPATTRVASGADLAFTFTPATGYALAEILVDGTAQASAASTYTFRQVGADHSLSATFLPSGASSMLAAYGVTPVTTAPVDPDTGSAVATGFNPLGGRVTKLNRQQGICLTGLNVPTSASAVGVTALWPELMAAGSVDWGGYLGALPGGLTPAWLASPHATAAGDLDGSGKDSVVTVYFNCNGSPGNPPINRDGNPDTGTLNLVLTSPNGQSGAVPGTLTGPQTITSQQEFFVYGDAAWALTHDTTDVNGQIQVALADIDADGQLEIAVAVDSTFMILKKNAATGSYAVMSGFPVNYRSIGTTTSYSGFWTCRLAAGDINGDGRDEVVVTVSLLNQATTALTYHVYAVPAGASACGEIAAGSVSDANGTTLLCGNVAIGDLKGDGGREVIFAGASSLAGGRATTGNVIMGSWDGSPHLALPGGTATASVDLTSYVSPMLPMFCLRQGMAQAGGNGLAPQALLALNQIWTWNASRTPPLAAINQMDPRFKQTYGYMPMAAGNVLGATDGSDQIVAALYATSGVQSLYVYTINYGSGTLPAMLCPASTQLSTGGGMPTGNNSTLPFRSLCLPDWSGRSTEVVFTGREANVLYSPPEILAVIASPPYYGELTDPAYLASLGGCTTTWGTSQGTSFTQTHSFNFSAKKSLGFKYSFEEAQSETEMKASITASFSHSASQMTSQSVSHSYSLAAGADYVLYTVVPYDVYTYEQVGVANHGMTISFPRTPQMMILEVGAYNALPNQGNPLDTRLLAHTLGVPGSYPSHAAMQALLAQAGQGPGILWDPSGVQVFTHASGYSTSSVTQAASTSQTSGFGLGLTLEWQLTTGGVLFGREYDFSGEVQATLETDNGAFFSGSSPYLPARVPFTCPPFFFGIAAYPVSLANQGMPFTLVTYWYSQQSPGN